MGILHPSTNREWMRFTVSNCALFIIYSSYLISVVSFLFIEAQTFIEYADATFQTLSGVLFVIWYTMMVWDRKGFSQLFSRLDANVEQSNGDNYKHFAFLGKFEIILYSFDD